MIRFFTVSATYSVPARSSPTPVGPRTNAAGSVFSAKPEPILVLATTRGGRSQEDPQPQPDHGAAVYDLAAGRDGAVQHVGDEQPPQSGRD